MATSQSDAGVAARTTNPRDPQGLAGTSTTGPSRMRPATLTFNDLPRRFGRYVLLRRIAKGGMGEVMLASTLGLEGAERPVIIKTIRTEHRTDKSFKARFLDEARVQSQLEHPGVAQVLEATTDDESGEPYVAVEYVDGKSLGDVRSRSITTGQRIEWHEAVAIAHLAAEALSHVHERVDAQGQALSIVHRDLSPQNLMVSYGGEVKIIDFGTARGENRRCHTVSGVVFAKPGYVAPEVANGDPGDFRVDLYALGVMLWELCSGRRFLAGEASDHMAAVARNDRNLPPVAEACGAPRALDEILARLTAFDRKQRFTKTRQAARDLASILVMAPPLAGGERGVRGRVSALMTRLFEADAARTRREFARLVSEARKIFGAARTPAAATPRTALVMRDEQEGLLPGTRYRTGREMGRGSGTVVYEAEHVDLGRRVALKLQCGSDNSSAAVQARLRREARVLSGLAIEGVVRVLDAGKTLDGRGFSVLELCQGDTLEQKLRDCTVLPWREALALVDKLLEVLDGVHRAGFIHRDIKPSNVVVNGDGRVTLLDFGIAISQSERLMSDLETPAPRGKAIALYGTPEYMAPEQAARPSEVDERADIYSIGAVLYEVLTGVIPFTGDSAVVILELKAKGSPEAPSVRLRTRELPREVDELCLRALSRHPSLRFESAEEMRAAIRNALAAPERARARRRTLGYSAVAFVMAAAIAVGVKGASRDQRFGWTQGAAGAHPTKQPADKPATEEVKSTDDVVAVTEQAVRAASDDAAIDADAAAGANPAASAPAVAAKTSEGARADEKPAATERKARRAEKKVEPAAKKKSRKRTSKSKTD
ncbi:MAG: serine/threonine-protein kinase [Polyangiaceae bacterium]